MREREREGGWEGQDRGREGGKEREGGRERGKEADLRIKVLVYVGLLMLLCKLEAGSDVMVLQYCTVIVQHGERMLCIAEEWVRPPGMIQVVDHRGDEQSGYLHWLQHLLEVGRTNKRQ